MAEREFRAGERAHYDEHLAYFARDARVEVDGQAYGFAEGDLEELAYEGRFFALAGRVNTSVVTSAISIARRRFQPPLHRAAIIELCAGALRMTVAEIESSLEWTANYMAFHDGMDPAECHPYPPSEP